MSGQIEPHGDERLKGLDEVRKHWKVAAVSHFLDCFSREFGLPKPCVEDLESAIVDYEPARLITELHINLLKGPIDPENIKLTTWFDELRKLCAEYNKDSAQNGDVPADKKKESGDLGSQDKGEGGDGQDDEEEEEDEEDLILQELPPLPEHAAAYRDLDYPTRITVLKSLCDWHLEFNPAIKAIAHDKPADEIRCEPFYVDDDGDLFYNFTNRIPRVYRETPEWKSGKGKNIKVHAAEWNVVSTNLDELKSLYESKKKSKKREDKDLAAAIEEHLLEPFGPKWEADVRKRERALMLELMPRKRSGRIQMQTIAEEERKAEQEKAAEIAKERARIEKQKRLEREAAKAERERIEAEEAEKRAESEKRKARQEARDRAIAERAARAEERRRAEDKEKEQKAKEREARALRKQLRDEGDLIAGLSDSQRKEIFGADAGSLASRAAEGIAADGSHAYGVPGDALLKILPKVVKRKKPTPAKSTSPAKKKKTTTSPVKGKGKKKGSAHPPIPKVTLKILPPTAPPAQEESDEDETMANNNVNGSHGQGGAQQQQAAVAAAAEAVRQRGAEDMAMAALVASAASTPAAPSMQQQSLSSPRGYQTMPGGNHQHPQPQHQQQQPQPGGNPAPMQYAQHQVAPASGPFSPRGVASPHQPPHPHQAYPGQQAVGPMSPVGARQQAGGMYVPQQSPRQPGQMNAYPQQQQQQQQQQQYAPYPQQQPPQQGQYQQYQQPPPQQGGYKQPGYNYPPMQQQPVGGYPGGHGVPHPQYQQRQPQGYSAPQQHYNNNGVHQQGIAPQQQQQYYARPQPQHPQEIPPQQQTNQPPSNPPPASS